MFFVLFVLCYFRDDIVLILSYSKFLLFNVSGSPVDDWVILGEKIMVRV